MFVYDDFSAIAGPDCVLVGFEQRCGRVYRSPSAAERHEATCSLCQTYRRPRA